MCVQRLKSLGSISFAIYHVCSWNNMVDTKKSSFYGKQFCKKNKRHMLMLWFIGSDLASLTLHWAKIDHHDQFIYRHCLYASLIIHVWFLLIFVAAIAIAKRISYAWVQITASNLFWLHYITEFCSDS